MAEIAERWLVSGRFANLSGQIKGIGAALYNGNALELQAKCSKDAATWPRDFSEDVSLLGSLAKFSSA